MKRHWSHWVGLHDFCHPARCKASADAYNRIEAELRAEHEEALSRSRLRSGFTDPSTYREDML